MSTDISLLPSDQRPLPLRMRRDLISQPLRFGGRTFWSIKDPVTLRYYQLREEEYFVLQALDGQNNVATIRAAFDQQFAPRRLGNPQLQWFLSMLHGQGLIVADAPGQGEKLLQRHRHHRRQQFLASLVSILAIRLRGMDPERFLCWLYPKCRWMFSPWCVMASMLLTLSALSLVAVQFEAFQTRLPSFHAFFNVQNMLWIALAIGTAKVLHEFGHALACKHFGGECHEMGVMFLVFMPCLYCNVSDAWMMPNKWHRVAISAAGMYVEIVLASICTFLWWFSEPGLLNAICLNMMFVCSVSTLLFNGNPLLRYDGYYILSDLVEVPNLRGQSTSLLWRAVARVCLGIETAKGRPLPERRQSMLMGYAVAAVAYRVLVVIAILWFLHAVLSPYGLQFLVQILTLLVIGGMIGVPLWRGFGFLRSTIRDRQMKWLRTTGCLVVAAILILAFCLVPLPHRITAPVLIEPRDATRVYVEVPGKLTQLDEKIQPQPGDTVRQSQDLAVLQDPELDKEIERLRGQVNVLTNRVDSTIARRISDEKIASQLPATQEALRNTNQRLQQKLVERRRLTLKAPTDGIVLPPPLRSQEKLPDDLETWSGTPMDKNNVGCYLESGTLFCLIGNPKKLEATLIVDQANVEFIRPGQQVRVALQQLPAKMLTGTIEEISDSQLDTAPRELIANGGLPVITDASGVQRPANASFHARVKLDPHEHAILLRSTGQAKVYVDPVTLGMRLYRYLCSTFRFEI